MASSTTNGAAHATNGVSPKITLYTNHGCPWAQRAHIVLKELDLPYEEVIIDLDTPRPDWYLKINPVSALAPYPAIPWIPLPPPILHQLPSQTSLTPSQSVVSSPQSSTAMTSSTRPS